MQRAAIVGVSLGLPFALTGCGNSSGSNVNACDSITQSAPNPVTGEEHTATITVNLHGGGNSACCQYFADSVGGTIPSTVPDGCSHASHVSLTVQVDNGDCSSYLCALVIAHGNGIHVSESIAGIPDGCCGELQTAVQTGDPSGVSEKCNGNTYCLMIDQREDGSATSSLAATLNQLHLATPSMMYAKLSKYQSILGVYDSIANVSGVPKASDAIV